MAKVKSSEIRKSNQAQRREIEQALKLKTDLESKEIQHIHDTQKILDQELVKSKYQLIKEYDELANKHQVELLKSQGKIIQANIKEAFGTWDSTYNTLSKAAGSLLKTIDQSLDKYISAQQSLAAHLSGSDSSLAGMLDSLQSTLSTTNIVRQEKVFDTLGTLVKSGITYNVEQRAFLQTLTRDIDMVFNAQDGSLTQLIRLQNQDLSANRAAIEYSLQKFLNQNYQTSEYIKEAFSSVSGALKTAQSTMTASNAVGFEGTVQAWLGSMFSAGMDTSTVNNLANALNELGSGDISHLGSGISNLVLMGAARAGLDYGSLLNNGLTAETTDKLMSSIAGYLQEMSANNSNVVRSQLGNLFGVSITDIIASNNLRSSAKGAVSSDISTLFDDYNSFITHGTGLQNSIANMLWSFGTNIASSESNLMAYEISSMISKSGIGDILWQYGDSLGNSNSKILGALGSAMQIAGLAATNAPLIPIIGSLFGDIFNGGGNGFLDDLSSSFGTRGAAAIFDALGSGALSGSTIKISNAGVSGGIYMSNGGTSDLLNSSTSSLNGLTGTSTSVEAEDEGPTLEENVTSITDTVTSILDVLTERLESIDSAISDIARNPALTGWSSVTHFSV